MQNKIIFKCSVHSSHVMPSQVGDPHRHLVPLCWAEVGPGGHSQVRGWWMVVVACGSFIRWLVVVSCGGLWYLMVVTPAQVQRVVPLRGLDPPHGADPGSPPAGCCGGRPCYRTLPGEGASLHLTSKLHLIQPHPHLTSPPLPR